MNVGTLYSSAARTTALDSIGGNSFDSTIPGLLQQAIVAVGNNGGGGVGGSTAWGSITGTLSNQTDLQSALNLKANLSSPDFVNRINILGGGITSGLLHIYDADSSHSVRFLTSSSLAANYTLTIPAEDGTLALRGANTFTALQQFSGTTHAGLRLNNLTTAERDAVASPQAGMAIWNTTAARLQLHNGSAWTAGMVRLDGDTMTGALTIPVGSAAATSLNFGTAGTGIYSASGAINFSIAGTLRWSIDSGGILQGGSNSFQLSGNFIASNSFLRLDGPALRMGASDDVAIGRDGAAETLALGRRNTSANTFRIYGTYTDASNYERFTITTTAGSYTVGAQAAGTGTLRGVNAVGTWSYTAEQTVSVGANSPTAAAGLTLINSTAATAGVQSASPLFTQTGQGWKTTATAASQSVAFLTSVLPVQGTTAPTGTWRLQSSINGASAIDRLSLNTSVGTLTLGSTSGSNSTSLVIQGTDRSGTLTLSAFGSFLSALGGFDITGNTAILRMVDANASVRFGSLNGIADAHLGFISLTATAQKVSVYRLATDASNYERLALSSSAGVFSITCETAGTGADDIDLTLTPAGTGNVRFGSHSAVGVELVTGFITIKDAGGTSRKLAVIS